MGRTFDREEDLHGAVAELFAAVLHPSVVYFHVPNGAAWKRAKNIAGVRRGVPDWYLAWQAKDWAGCETGWIELKSKTGRVSPQQLHFKTQVRALFGHHWGSTGTIEGVQAYLMEWRVPLRGRLTA